MYGSIIVYYAWLFYYCGILNAIGEANTTGGMYWIIYDQVQSIEYWIMLPIVVMAAFLPHYIITVSYTHLTLPTIYSV